MGTRSTDSTLTETGDGPAPAGAAIYVGIDIGRRTHVVAAIPSRRMEDGSWDRTATKKIASSAAGYRQLTQWLSELEPDARRVAIGTRADRRLVRVDGGQLA